MSQDPTLVQVIAMAAAVTAVGALYYRDGRKYDVDAAVRSNTVIGRPVDTRYGFDTPETQQAFISYAIPLMKEEMARSKSRRIIFPFNDGIIHILEPLMAQADNPDYKSTRFITKREMAELQARSSVLVAKLEPIQ